MEIIFLIACPTEEYLTVDKCLGIPSLMDSPLGYDKCWITLNSPGIFLGWSPKGEKTMSSSGGDVNGPDIRPRSRSFFNLLVTISGCSYEDLRFRGGCVGVNLVFDIVKPFLKPEVR